MRVALNLLGVPTLRQGGAPLYAEGLARALAGHPAVRPLVLAGDRVTDELDAGGDGPAYRTVARAGNGRARKALELLGARRDPRRYRDGYEHLQASALEDCDLVHYPLGFATQPVHSLPSVVTCMDLQHVELPEMFSRGDRVLRGIRWHGLLRSATRILAPSQYTRDSLVRHLDLDAERIDVVPLACHERFFHAPPAAPPDLPDDFLLYPASPLPAKNHARLLEAFARARSQVPSLTLVLSGPAQHDWSAVQRQVRELALDDAVLLRGHLGLDGLRAHYARARALVFPSLFEGFGLPLVEAMAAGCPVLAAQTTSVPEVVGDAAIGFDPRDEQAIAGAIVQMAKLPDPARQDMIARGRERARRFQISAMVEATVGTYERALGGAT